MDTFKVLQLKLDQIEKKIDEKNELISNIDLIYIKLNELLDKVGRAKVRLFKDEILEEYTQSIEEARVKNHRLKLRGKIRIGRIKDKFDKGARTPISMGYLNVDIATNKSPYTQLIPSTLTYNNKIFENIWQFSKLHRIIPQKKLTFKLGEVWSWNKESHINQGNLKRIAHSDSINDLVDESYWAWRRAGFSFHHIVRYSDENLLGWVWPEKGENNLNFNNAENMYFPMKLYQFKEAIKNIYQPLYLNLIKNTEHYQELKQKLESGYNLQLLDYNGPKIIYQNGKPVPPYENMISGAYGEDKVGSIEFQKDTLDLFLTPDTFSHAYVLADALLDE